MGLNPTIDHLAIVEQERAKADAMPPGNERAWTITNNVCLRLAALGEDAGLLWKGSGTNWLGYSIDRVMYRDSGALYDCLQDGEGAANPQWHYDGPTNTQLWRPPIGDLPVPPDPPTPPDDGCPCEAEFAALHEELDALRGQVEALAQAVDAVLATIHTGLWDAKLSHAWLGTLTGTVGPLRPTP